MLSKICGYHGSDYEECRLLGYKHPGHTSQETHYVSATELSRLMLYKISGFQGGDYEKRRVDLIRTYVSGTCIASIFRVKIVNEL
jgi:hypothetical protein